MPEACDRGEQPEKDLTTEELRQRVWKRDKRQTKSKLTVRAADEGHIKSPVLLPRPGPAALRLPGSRYDGRQQDM